MAFINSRKKTAVADTPELMYEDYKQRKIKELTSSQADIIRGYTKLANDKDIALELPTGSGKTLVGLVIGEWRRKKNNEKVLFLCPTRQLVHQVKKQAEESYGIKVTDFVGRIRDFSDEQKTNWRMNKTIAIATYSAFFNTNSFFEDAEILIFDDAHSSENYIADMWTANISEEEYEDLFLSISNVIKPSIPQIDYLKLVEDGNEFDPSWVEMLPGPYFVNHKEEIFQVISTYLKENPDDSLKYNWSVIKDHLHACNLYYSQTGIVIRPLVPPTKTLDSFENAKQRIYMSATLGEGGDLERITGVKNITRVKSPEKWQTRAVGRRLIFFPELNFSKDKYDILGELLKHTNKALLVTSSANDVEEFKESMDGKLKKFIFVDAKEFESDPDKFYNAEKAVLCFANRYDGLDLNGDKCRLLVLDRISTILNHQDRFFSSRLGAKSVYLGRITTRLTQAVGRCTRSENDYSLVYILGDELTDLYYDKQYRNLLNPELQAEIKFGADESGHEETTKESFVENFKIFIEQGEDWKAVEDTLAELRNDSKKHSQSGVEDLSKAVAHEIDFTYNFWKESYQDAFDNCKSIIGCLNDTSLQAYRTYWNYSAGFVSFLLASESGSGSREYVDYFKQAAKSSKSIKWFSKLTNDHVSGDKVEDNSSNLEQLQNMIAVFKKDGLTHNGKFDARIARIFEYTTTGDSKKFESAQVELGILLGFKADKVETDASPDPWWILDDNNVVVFEAHSDGSKENTLSATKARQAATHANWMRTKLKLSETTNIIQVLITPKQELSDGAHAQIVGAGVCLWPLADYKSWTTKFLAEIREIRKGCSEEDLIWRATTLEKCKNLKISPKELVDYFLSFQLKE